MKFAAAIHATTDFGDDRIPFPDALAMVSECGFSDVMLLARRGAGSILRRGETPPGALINLLESDLGIVSGLLQRNGISPRIVFASGINPAEPESADWLRQMAEVARRLQCRFVGHNCTAAPAPGMSTSEKAEQITALAALIDSVASDMEDIQFAVDVHYHGLVEMIPDCDFYLEHLRSPNAGLLLNMGHMTTNRQPGWELAEDYPDRTPIIAWKDHFAGTDRERPAQSFQLGTAETPFEKYVEVIKPQVSDRAHVISVEGIEESKRREVLAASHRYMTDLWDRF